MSFGFKTLFLSAMAAVVFIGAHPVMAADGSVSAKQEPQRQFGGNVGIGDPFPGIFGINVGYNLTNDIRLTAGYAEIEMTTSIGWNGSNFESESVKASTYGVGGQYLFTDWAVRPTIGAHVGYFAVSGKGKIAINGFEDSKAYGYSNAGFDWVSDTGYHVALGMNVALLGSNATGFYTNVGYFY